MFFIDYFLLIIDYCFAVFMLPSTEFTMSVVELAQGMLGGYDKS